MKYGSNVRQGKTLRKEMMKLTFADEGENERRNSIGII
jgi:hypothetical protein